MESGGNGRSSAGGGDNSRAAGASSNHRGGSVSRSSGGSGSGASSRTSSVSGGGIIVSTSGAGGGGLAPPPASEWEMFQFGKYSMDILEMLSGHQAHQFKGLGLERQLQHQQQAQLQHQQQLQQQPGETSGPLLSGLGLGALQGSRSNAFADSSSIFAKMSAPPPALPQQTQSSSQSSRKSSKMSLSSGSGGSATGYPQFLRPFHPAEAALAQEQLHPGLGRFEHFSPGSSSGVAPPPLPPLHPSLSIPQASSGQPSSSPSPSTSASTSNNPSSSVASLGQQLVGAQSDARSLHQQFSCMLAANQYFLSGVPPNASLEQFLVQQGTHNHLSVGLGQGGDSNSGIASPPALHPSHSHGHLTPQQPQQQQQLPPHALSHPHHLHSAPQPPPLSSFDFQGIPVLSSNQIASLMQQESGLPLPLPLHLSLHKDEGKDIGGGVLVSGGGRRKKAMAGYLPQRKSESLSGSSSSSNCDLNPSSNSGGHSLDGTSGLVGGAGRIGISGLGGDPSSLSSSAQTSSSATVSSSSSSAPSSTSTSVLVTNCSQLPKIESQGPQAPTPTQPEPEPLYHCGECGKTFTHLSSLRRHLRSHGLSTGGGNISNNITNLDSNHNPSLPHSTQDLTSQSNQHHQQPRQDPSLSTQQQSNPAPTSSSCPSPEKTHSCPECGKGFKKRGHLLQHGVIHSGARPFACSVCQRSFNRRESLTRHEKIHEDKPFRCPACGRCFRESTSLLNHAASGTCGKPGRRSRSRRSNSNNSIETDGQKSHKVEALGVTGMVAGGSGVGEYQGGQLGGGVTYGKTEAEGVVGCVMGVDEEEDKASLSCQGLFQQGRGANANNVGKTEGKYSQDFSRNCYQAPYRGDDFRGEYKQQRSQTNPSCYPSDPSCGNGMAGPALRKAPLAPTLHPHPQSQTQQQHQQQHLPLSSLLDESEDDVTSSVSSAMSAIAAAAAASCMPGELNSGGSRGEERRDIIGGLLGGLSFEPVGASPGGPSSTSGIDKAYRGQGGNSECMGSTVMTSTNPNQQPNHQQAPNAKPKRPRKPRAKKEPRTPGGASGEVKRKRQSGAGTSGEGRERPFLCSVCGRGFSRRETLRRHDRVHTGEKPYHCSVCGKDFREAFHLTKHRTVHSGEKNYKCELCGKEFGYAQSLKRHGKLHQKGELGDAGTTAGVSNSSVATPGVNVSQEGDQGNSDSYYYSQDKPLGSNTQPPPRLYTCAICWKSFRHHFHLTAHQQAVHEGGDKLFCCEVCGKAFAYANSLTRHRLSQHGLSRTGQTHPPGSEGTGRVGGRPGVSGSANESDEATNALLQLVPPGIAQGGQQHSSVPPTQHAAPPQPPSGYSPLFYVPESGSSHPSASSGLPHSHPLQTHSTHTALSHHQQSAGIKGEPIYPTCPSNALNLASPAIYHPLSQQYPHSQQQQPIEMQSPHLQQQGLHSQGNIRKHKKKKKKCGYRDTRGESSDIARGGKEARDCDKRASARERKNEQRRLQKRKIRRIHLQLFKKKRRLAELLRVRGGRTRHGGLRVGRLSSLDVPQKHFLCPFCPGSAFPRLAAFLVHRAARHPQSSSCNQARLDCRVCGKHSRKFLSALRHRSFHLAQGSFSCPRCPSRFWNGNLLERHMAACQGVRGGGGDWGVKLKMVSKRTVK